MRAFEAYPRNGRLLTAGNFVDKSLPVRLSALPIVRLAAGS